MRYMNETAALFGGLLSVPAVLAHAGEHHGTTTETTTHLFVDPVAIAGAFLVLGVVTLLVRRGPALFKS